MNIQNLVLDINKKPFQIITANTGEVASRFIRINIVDGATPIDLTGITVSIYAEKPDGKKVFNSVTIEDKTNGIVLAELTSQTLVVAGIVKLNLLLEKDNARLCTKQFLLKVDKSLVDDEAIESVNEFGVLTKALNKVDEWNGYFEETSGKIEEKYTERLNQVDSQLAQIAHISNKFNFSSSKFLTNGSILAGTNILTVNDIGDFKVGQGIAIYNATKLRNTEDAWLCSEIISINRNEIIIKDYATHSITNTQIEHDNYYPFKKMENYFKDLNYVNIEFEQGEYLLHSVHQETVSGLFETNNIDSVIFTISNKDCVNINFKGSTFMCKGEYKLKKDYTVLNQYHRTGVKAPTFVSVEDCNNVVIKNGTYNAKSMTNILSKTDVGESWCYGFNIRGGHNILLENLTSLENESDGFYIGHQDTNPLYNVKIKNCTALHNGRQGLSVGGGAYVDIENCNFSYTGKDINGENLIYIAAPSSGIDLEHETGFNIPEELEKYSSIRNINIKKCILENNNYTLANGAYEGYLNIEDSYLGYNISGTSSTFFILCKAKDIVTFKNCTLETVCLNHMAIDSKKILFDNCIFKGIHYLSTSNETKEFNIINSDIYFSWGEAIGIFWIYNAKKDIHKISNSNIYYSKEYIVRGGYDGISGELSNCKIIYEDLDNGQTNKKSLIGPSLMDNVKVYDNAQNSYVQHDTSNFNVIDMGDYSLVTNVQNYVKSINLGDYELTTPRQFTGDNNAISVTITNATNHIFLNRVYATVDININVTQYFGVRTVFLTGSYTTTAPIKITISDDSPYTFSGSRKSVQIIPTSQKMRIDFILTLNNVINVIITDFNYAILNDVDDAE